MTQRLIVRTLLAKNERTKINENTSICQPSLWPAYNMESKYFHRASEIKVVNLPFLGLYMPSSPCLTKRMAEICIMWGERTVCTICSVMKSHYLARPGLCLQRVTVKKLTMRLVRHLNDPKSWLPMLSLYQWEMTEHTSIWKHNTSKLFRPVWICNKHITLQMSFL